MRLWAGATMCSLTLHCEPPPGSAPTQGLVSSLGILGCLLACPVPVSRCHPGISLSFLKSRGGWDTEVSQRGSQLKKESPHFPGRSKGWAVQKEMGQPGHCSGFRWGQGQLRIYICSCFQDWSTTRLGWPRVAQFHGTHTNMALP